MNKETIRELRERADGMITAGIANKDALFAALPLLTKLQAKAESAVTAGTTCRTSSTWSSTGEPPRTRCHTSRPTRSSNAQNAVRRSESARLLCKPKGKRRLAACSRWKFRFPTSAEDGASPLRNTRKRKENENEVED